MKDLFDRPRKHAHDLQVFNFTGGWQNWDKPRGCSMVMMVCIGSGGGGGGGFTGISGSARGGGGGGGSGGITKLLIPAFFLPDRLYIKVGGGGVGGGPSDSPVSGDGEFSYISAKHGSILAPDLFLVSSSSITGSRGLPGTGAAAGAGGTAPTIALVTDCRLSSCGLFLAIAGIAGAAGGAHTGAVGANITALASIQLTGGAGGGGTTSANFAGGDIAPGGYINAINGGVNASPPGNAGILLSAGGFPFTSTGGSGGAGRNNNPGGNGGQGNVGSGGGGAGGGTTGGTGGKGGDGLIVISAW